MVFCVFFKWVFVSWDGVLIIVFSCEGMVFSVLNSEVFLF